MIRVQRTIRSSGSIWQLGRRRGGRRPSPVQLEARPSPTVQLGQESCAKQLHVMPARKTPKHPWIEHMTTVAWRSCCATIIKPRVSRAHRTKSPTTSACARHEGRSEAKAPAPAPAPVAPGRRPRVPRCDMSRPTRGCRRSGPRVAPRGRGRGRGLR